MSYAFLDIETSWEKRITVIGVYRPGLGTRQLVAPSIKPRELIECLEGVTTIFTFNGGRFDLPVIAQHMGVELDRRHGHRDLMFDCWKKKLRGGLKAVERTLGIHRDSEGVNGLQAMNLWAAHVRDCGPSDPISRCCDPLEILLRYNREDCENLEILAWKLGVIKREVPTPQLELPGLVP
jgi:uncharacterized protein